MALTRPSGSTLIIEATAWVTTSTCPVATAVSSDFMPLYLACIGQIDTHDELP
jgi:hypothetical protein